MTYKVVLSRQAQRYFASAPPDLAKRLARAFETLESHRSPAGAKPLKGDLAGLFRIRIGSIRLIYEWYEEIGEVKIVKISPRGDAY